LGKLCISFRKEETSLGKMCDFVFLWRVRWLPQPNHLIIGETLVSTRREERQHKERTDCVMSNETLNILTAISKQSLEIQLMIWRLHTISQSP
jgi:hypothetical protein